MKILVIGNGGREHAIVWKLSKDSVKHEMYCAPGNAGTASLATNIDISAEDIPALLKWAKENKPDLTVAGPEAPLCAGITDVFQSAGLKVFGPSKAAAQIEGSKMFSKNIMVKGGVPTAFSEEFHDYDTAALYINAKGAPIVIKADGLAAGKGVYVCADVPSALKAIDDIFVKKIFGSAGTSAIIEECLVGQEASILALVDGREVVMLSSAQDHKRAYNNDMGPNTGGMGAYSPAPVVKDDLWPVIKTEVFDRTLAELRRRGIEYKGVLYAGIMLTQKGPMVLEFNCRFGDPETQVILPRMDCDLAPVLMACVDGRLSADMIKWKKDVCVCVVLASGGYPDKYEKGKPVFGLEEAGRMSDVIVFHAGTVLREGKVVTSGGRVFGVTSLGASHSEARRKAYDAITKVVFDQMQYRSDIANKAINA
jgi:phosphoribosylamine--glycine ligase